MKKRNSGLDIYRILCCCGVLTYHTASGLVQSSAAVRLLYFSASFCIPGFFLLSGFLLGTRESVTIEYCESKVFGTIKKLFFWTIFWTAAMFAATGNMPDLWDNVTAGAASSGILPVAWFLFTYCLLMIAAYPLRLALDRYPAVFIAAAVVWMVCLAFGLGRQLTAEFTQSLWLHLYGGYFVLGMALSRAYRLLTGRGCVRAAAISAGAVFAVCSAFYIHSVGSAEKYIMPNGYYGTWYYTLWLVSGFLLCCFIRFDAEKVRAVLARLSGNTFVVYLGHLPLLQYAPRLLPIRSFFSVVLYIAGLFIGLELAAEIFRRTPVLRKLV